MTLLSERMEIEVSRVITGVVLDHFLKNRCPTSLCELVSRIFRLRQRALLRNKVLTPISLFLITCCGYRDKVVEFRVRRHNTYMGACRELAEAFDRRGVEYVVIKTIRDFPADIADIDLLVRPENRLEGYEVLKGLGYQLRKESRSQDLWTKVTNGIVVDVELHTSVSMAGFSYVENDIIFTNIEKKEGIRVPNKSLGIVLDSAHAVMKDLEVKLSDVLELVYYLLMNTERQDRQSCASCRLVAYSRALGLTAPLGFLAGLGTRIYPAHAGAFKELSQALGRAWLVGVPSVMPVKPPLQVVLAALVEKAVSKASRQGVYSTIRELLTILRSKGTDALTAYMSGKAVTKDIFEDMVDNKSPSTER